MKRNSINLELLAFKMLILKKTMIQVLEAKVISSIEKMMKQEMK